MIPTNKICTHKTTRELYRLHIGECQVLTCLLNEETGLPAKNFHLNLTVYPTQYKHENGSITVLNACEFLEDDPKNRVIESKMLKDREFTKIYSKIIGC